LRSRPSWLYPAAAPYLFPDSAAAPRDEDDPWLFVFGGVPGARNTAGELLGFDRVETSSHLPTNQIAGDARRFGQEDDIAVIAIQRLARYAA
jgi:hypothetical protein